MRLVVHGGQEVDPLGAGHRADRPVQAGQQQAERRCFGVGHVGEVGEVAAGLDPQRPGQGHVGRPMADQPVPVRHEPPSRWRVLTGSVLGAVVAVTPLHHAVLVRDMVLRHAAASPSVLGE